MEIEENNKLIADFIGLEKKESYGGLRYFYNNAYSTDLRFYVSWEWLMPVVEKIESLPGSYHVQIGRTGNGGASNNMAAVVSMYVDYSDYNCFEKYFYPSKYGWSNGKNKFEAVYIAVIEFIKWYNIQTK